MQAKCPLRELDIEELQVVEVHKDVMREEDEEKDEKKEEKDEVKEEKDEEKEEKDEEKEENDEEKEEKDEEKEEKDEDKEDKEEEIMEVAADRKRARVESPPKTPKKKKGKKKIVDEIEDTEIRTQEAVQVTSEVIQAERKEKTNEWVDKVLERMKYSENVERPKGQNLRRLVFYDKGTEIEKRLAKMKGLVREKPGKDMFRLSFSINTMEKERMERLREAFPDNVRKSETYALRKSTQCGRLGLSNGIHNG
uniref:Uncharacterized protein n=1 Tax=Octopus bimaculoides TaxID=37653 RepID=A0A0L8G840_OCTBM